MMPVLKRNTYTLKFNFGNYEGQKGVTNGYSKSYRDYL
jgi:hypothetical protein